MIDKTKLENLLSDIQIELEDLESEAKALSKMAAEARKKLEEIDLGDDDE